MRYLGLILWMGCTSPEVLDWDPESSWTWEDSSTPEVLLSGLIQPMGLAAASAEQFWVADVLDHRVHRIHLSGDVELTVEGLVSPRWVAAGLDWLVVTESAEDGRVLAFQGEATGPPLELAAGASWGQVVFDGTTFWWFEDGDEVLFHWSPGDVVASSATLTRPIQAIASTPTGVMVAMGTSKPWLIVDQASEVQAELWEEPQQMVWGNGTLWMSTRSPRWPFPGWIYRLDEGEAKVVQYSPPEPGPIVTTEDSVFWGSKQTLARASLGGAAYEAVGLQTAVGALISVDQHILWTDYQRGLLLTWSD